MIRIENGKFRTETGQRGTDIPVTPREEFMKGVYAQMDKAIAGALDHLCKEGGIIPMCRLGCCHCCRYHILINIAEAHTLAQYLKREWSKEKIHDLQARTRQWHTWDYFLRNSRPSTDLDAGTDFPPYGPCCPLLVGGECSAYPVRPVVCRTHFVSSPPLSCHAANNPGSTEAAPVALISVVTAASPYSKAIRSHIEHAGLEFSRTQMLLPHWLAMEMGWDFAPALSGRRD